MAAKAENLTETSLSQSSNLPWKFWRAEKQKANLIRVGFYTDDSTDFPYDFRTNKKGHRESGLSH